VELYLDVLHCFFYECCQMSVHVCARGVRVSGPVRSEVADHQVKVIPLQSSQSERLADRADLGQTHSSLLKLCRLLFQTDDECIKQ